MNSFIGKNTIENLSQILELEKAKNVLVFTGRKSFEKIKAIIEKELQDCTVTYYSDFSTNPKKEEIDIAIDKIGNNFDVIIAVGGGSVIDFAKGYRYYTEFKKMIAVPTTCGTGSEATQFAVIYINGVKTSLDKPEILPDYAIIDSQFVEDNPKYLKACTAMDAYCQAIESYWATKSSEESRKYAMQAIELCKNNIVEYINFDDSVASEKMALASHLAGRAINISRTTASHALSYKITSQYGIPHGHAVSLSIMGLFDANNQANEQNIIDSRGLDFVQKRMSELNAMFNQNYQQYFLDLFEQIGLEISLSKLNISNTKEIVSCVNLDRLNNNPVRLSYKKMEKMFTK